MKTINLSDLNINKQILKRKIENDKCDDTHILELINRQTTKYTVDEIKKLISCLFTDVDKDKILSNEPLSSYYAKKNKEKYIQTLELLNLNLQCNIKTTLLKEIKKLIRYTEENIISYDELINNFEKISNKYHITIEEIEKQFYNLSYI